MPSVDLVNRAYDAVKLRNLEALLNIFSKDCVFLDMTELGVLVGHEEFAKYMNMTWDAFPDFHPAEAVFTAQGNVVAAELVLQGTHQGKFLGLEPSGVTVQWQAAAFYTIDNMRNQIVREVFYYDSNRVRTILADAGTRRS